jgi:acetolactate synthase-1/2/3 large subunit
VLDKELDEAQVQIPSGYRAKGRTRPDSRDIEIAAELLEKAERPAILAGTQVWLCRAVEALNALVEKTQIPICLNGAARGAVAADSQLLFSRSRRHALSRADVVMIIGTPFDFRLAYGNRIASGAKIIQVDLDYCELCHNRSVDVPIHADIASALEDLTAAVRPGGDRDAWRRELRAMENEILEQERELLLSDEVPIHPLRLAREINDFLSEDSIFVADGGTWSPFRPTLSGRESLANGSTLVPWVRLESVRHLPSRPKRPFPQLR